MKINEENFIIQLRRNITKRTQYRDDRIDELFE